MRLGHRVGRILTAFAPLIVTPALGWATNEGYLNFGGGEKDIILLIPWVLWSMIFAAGSLVCWRRRISLGRSLLWATAWATATLVVLWLVLARRLIGA
jgi:hypothetical protein